MRLKTSLFAICALLCAGAITMDAAPKGKTVKKHGKKGKVEAVDTTSASKKKDKYAEAIKDAKVYDGLIKAYFTPKNELFFEINQDNTRHLYLLTNRLVETSNDTAFAAGEMMGDQIMFRIEADTSYVRFYDVSADRRLREGDEIGEAFFKNHRDPVLKSFKVKASKKDSVFLIDMTSFFASNEKVITPLQYSSNLMGAKSGSFDSDVSKITLVKSFPENVEVSSVMNFKSEPNNYFVKVRRSILLLPDKPMKMRWQDNRVGYFSSVYQLYTSESDRVENKEFIHRWRLEPKKGQEEAYFAGELVEPEKPIVYYVDSSFPEKWRSAVKQGIEDWQTAFEAAGFKNAIIARDYPSPADSTDFDPDDIRFNCIRYIATDIANASGPSYVDPRSGEILTGDVNWFHNVISLVSDWRFCQTAAADPRARTKKMPDDLMSESLRYVASHEVGHTLGLMHNMGASWSYPVDSLRSPSFTQKYGTTPSIMDYARNNYVAQPGDVEKGVRMVPPILGVYDIYAINWGYRLYPGDLTPDQEKVEMNKLVASKADDPMYKFGAQQIFYNLSPADLTEDLGNDHIKASDYCIANLKRIVPELENWLREDGEDYFEIKVKLYNVASQYRRVLYHVFPYLGGMYFNDIVQGEPNQRPSREYVDKAKQKEAMNWLVDQMLTFRQWLLPERILDITGYGAGDLDSYQRAVVGTMFGASTLTIIAQGERSGHEGLYTLDGYMKDAVDAVLKNTLKRRKLTIEDMNMQNAMVATLAELADLVKPEGAQLDLSKHSLAAEAAAVHEAVADFAHEATCGSFCSHDHAAENSYYRQNNDLPKLSGAYARPLALKELKRILKIYRSTAAGADQGSRTFYDYQADKIERLMKK